MIEGRIGRGGRITVPMQVREALQLGAGDRLCYEVDGDRVIVSKGEASPDGDTEWDDGFDDATLQPLIDEALADPRPSVLIDEAFAEIRARIEARQRRRDAA